MAQQLDREIEKAHAALLDDPSIAPALKKQLSSMEGPIKGTGEQLLAQSLSDAAMRETLNGTLDVYPTVPVSVGESWTKGRLINYGELPRAASETWKLKTRRDGVAIAEMTGTISSNRSAPTASGAVGTIETSVSGRKNGTFEIDESTGWIIGTTVNLDLDVQQEMTGMMSLSLTQTVQGTVTMKTWVD